MTVKQSIIMVLNPTEEQRKLALTTDRLFHDFLSFLFNVFQIYLVCPSHWQENFQQSYKGYSALLIQHI